MAENEKIDVLLHVALPEESKIFWGGEFLKLEPQSPLETFPYHTFKYFDSGTNVSIKGIILTVGEVGDRTRDAIILFCTKFRPSFVFNVGISGRVGRDARVGDVVVPDQINIYDFRAAMRDVDGDGYEFVPGGQATTIDRLCFNVASSFEFSNTHPLPSFEDHCAASAITLLSDERTACAHWRSEGTLAIKPRIVSGPFAVGSFVNKSASFSRDLLLKTNRNIIAVDMESGLVGDALKSLTDPPRFYSIRAVSDPGTGDKPKFDSIGDGAIRQWAMANALRVIQGLLTTRALFATEAADDLVSSIAAESFGNHYLSDYPGQRYVDEVDLDGCDLRFANLTLNQQEGVTSAYLFRDFVQYLKDNPRNRRVRVDGHGGAGKSALLKIASVELRRQSGAPETLFLNMRLLRSRLDRRDLRQTLQSEIDRLAPNIMRGSQRVVVFFDELYGYEDERKIINTVCSILSRNRPTTVLAFGKDHYDTLRSSESTTRQSYIENMEFDLELTLRNISMAQQSVLLSVIEGTLKTGGLRDQGPPASVIAEKLADLRFSYANHFVISLYVANCRKAAFRSATNSTTFILMAMRFLCDNMLPHSDKVTLEDISVEALRAFSPVSSTAAISQAESISKKVYQEVFVHFPKIVQTALVANAVVHLLSHAYSAENDIFDRYGIERKTFYGLVFGNDVNSCVKDLLGDERVENRVLETAERLHQEVDPFALSYALYLFGRARSVAGRQKAQAVFETARSLLGLEQKHVATVQQLSQEEKYFRLAGRSLSISLALNNDAAATDMYIQRILEDPVEDSLNRSFHLEYYGDQSSFGINVDLSLKDSGKDWKRTKEFLGNKIRAMLSINMSAEYDRICIATYFSLVRYRLEAGGLPFNEREEHRQLGLAIIDGRFDLGTALNGFLAMMIDALGGERFDKIDALLKLFTLKHIPRAGWVKRGIAEDVDQAETVASHTWGAMLLADALMDWLRPALTETERSKVIKILLFHDIAEAFIGDYTPMDGDVKLKEPDAMARIAALATIEGLGGISRWHNDWEEFESRINVAAGLAKDFDKLDAVFQGLLLAERFPSSENRRKFFDDNIQQILHPQLRNLGQDVRRRADHISIAGTGRPAKPGTQ